MDIRILLVSREGAAKKKYLDAINKLGVQLDTVSTLKEGFKIMLDTPYNGVLVDLPTRIKAPADEKTLVHEVLEQYPVILLRWEKQTGIIKSLYYGQVESGTTIENFIEQECRSFKARTIRSSTRINMHFNVILARSNDFNENNIERTITINVSKGGCFIYSSESWERGSSAWLKIQELGNNTPIRGEVEWRIPWGKGMMIPGIGIMFKDIKECQLKEIHDSYFS